MHDRIKGYNNLVSSVATLVLFVLFLAVSIISALCLIPIHATVGLIISTVMAGATILAGYILIKHCFSYWIIYKDKVVQKKLLAKPLIINRSEIVVIVNGTSEVFDYGGSRYQKSYIIRSSSKEIIIIVTSPKKEREIRDGIIKYRYDQFL